MYICLAGMSNTTMLESGLISLGFNMSSRVDSDSLKIRGGGEASEEEPKMNNRKDLLLDVL